MAKKIVRVGTCIRPGTPCKRCGGLKWCRREEAKRVKGEYRD